MMENEAAAALEALESQQYVLSMEETSSKMATKWEYKTDRVRDLMIALKKPGGKGAAYLKKKGRGNASVNKIFE